MAMIMVIIITCSNIIFPFFKTLMHSIYIYIVCAQSNEYDTIIVTYNIIMYEMCVSELKKNGNIIFDYNIVLL